MNEREIGYYWVMYGAGLRDKSIAYWDGNGWLDHGCIVPHRDSYYYWIGPIVEEPK